MFPQLSSVLSWQPQRIAVHCLLLVQAVETALSVCHGLMILIRHALLNACGTSCMAWSCSMVFCRMDRRCASLAIVGVLADVSVELAVCCLLLGDSEKAEDVLGLTPGSCVQQADPAVRSFVLVCASYHARLMPD